MSELDKLNRKLARGEISRREFISGTATIGLAAALPSALFSGSVAAMSKKGGHFRMGKAHGQTTDTLNPGTFTNGFTIAMSHAFNGYLTEVGKDGSVQPGIAESWESTADAATWTFTLRKGVTFHSGKAVTPEDVITSINFHREEGSTSAAGPLVSGITEITTEGTDKIVFALKGGDADFPFTLSDYHLTISPVKDGKLDWASGDGCGVYKMTKFTPGISAKFERFDGHWANDRGFFDSIDMLALVDPNARTTALLTGEVDAIDRVDLKTAALLKRKPNVSVHTVSGNQHFTFAMACNQSPFSDVNVRQALKYGINREEMVQKILHGNGVVGNDHPIGSGQRFYNKELAQTAYDPDKSKFHLKQAGMSSLKVDLSAADAAFPGAIDAAVLFQNSAKESGIDIQVAREPNDGYWSDVWMKKSFAAVYWSGRPTEDAALSIAYKTGVAWNDAFWSNARFDKILDLARAELDVDKRRTLYYEAQQILNQDGGTIIPMFASYVFATSKAVEFGGDFGTNWDMDGERWAERWSFA